MKKYLFVNVKFSLSFIASILNGYRRPRSRGAGDGSNIRLRPRVLLIFIYFAVIKEF